jgi:hypothetical protein
MLQQPNRSAEVRKLIQQHNISCAVPAELFAMTDMQSAVAVAGGVNVLMHVAVLAAVQ